MLQLAQASHQLELNREIHCSVSLCAALGSRVWNTVHEQARGIVHGIWQTLPTNFPK